MLGCLLPSFGPCSSCFSVVFGTLPVKWVQISECSPGFAQTHAKACMVPESAFWQTTGESVLCEMNKKIGCSYLGQVLSRAGILRIFLCLVLLQAFILVLGELPIVPSSHFLHQSEGGLHLPTEEFNMRFSWSCSPILPQGTEPRPSAELSGSAAILGLTQLTQPQNFSWSCTWTVSESHSSDQPKLPPSCKNPAVPGILLFGQDRPQWTDFTLLEIFPVWPVLPRSCLMHL